MRIRSFLLIFFTALCSCGLCACTRKVQLESDGGQLGALGKRFSAPQQEALRGMTLQLVLDVPSSDSQSVRDEAVIRHAVTVELSFENRPPAAVTAQLSLECANTFTVGLYVRPEDTVSALRIDGLVAVGLVDARVVRPRIGWEKSERMGFYFGSAGGAVPVRGGSVVDSFAGLGADFAELGADFGASPLAARYELRPHAQASGKAKVRFGGELITLQFDKGAPLTVQCAALQQPFCRVDFADPEILCAFFLVPNDAGLADLEKGVVFSPLRTDPGLIIRWSRERWRHQQYELFEWEAFPGVLIFDTATYDIQSRFFTRLAFFAEKTGYRGRLLTDEELAGRHGYNAHDYRPESLAQFFTLAARLDFPLNQHEVLLRDILLRNGVIVQEERNVFAPGRGAVISISQESPEYLRRTFVNHECWHGIYFTRPEFRETVDFVRTIMDAASFDFLRAYFSLWPSLQYDPDDDYLIHNELMAYLMQQGVSACADYFTHLAGFATCQREIPQLANYVIRTNASGFVDACTVLDSYAEQTWGLNAGKVYYITR